MSDNLEKALEQVVNKALQVAEQTGQFVIEQAPDLLQEFYRWHLAKNALIFLFLWITGMALFKSYKRALKAVRENIKRLIEDRRYSDYDQTTEIVVVFATICYFASVCVMFYCLYQVAFILIAPKIYLIEYFVK